jgi:hypothetical protein
MPVLHVYSRQGCHLCEILIEGLLPLVRGVLAVEVHDIDTKPEWRSLYDMRVPVVEYEGQLVCQYHLDGAAIAELCDKVQGTGSE